MSDTLNFGCALLCTNRGGSFYQPALCSLEAPGRDVATTRRTFCDKAIRCIIPMVSGISSVFLVEGEVQAAHREGVNRPELLPSQFTTVIDLEKFLATGEVRRLRQQINDLETRTGWKLRILTQRFPQTPGLAIRDYWGVDESTIVMVADYFGGNQLLKFNVGSKVDALLPTRFWSQLSANLGNKFYVNKHGESGAIITAVDNIRVCLLQNGCKAPPYLKDTF